MIELGQRGALAELRAVAFLLEQGYQVFRNVSAHGPIDLIALRDGKFSYFDVKTQLKNGIPAHHRSAITPVQRDLGIRLIFVSADGGCRIEELPGVVELRKCEDCGRTFKPRLERQVFCGGRCRQHAKYERERLARLSGVEPPRPPSSEATREYQRLYRLRQKKRKMADSARFGDDQPNFLTF